MHQFIIFKARFGFLTVQLCGCVAELLIL